MATLLIILFFSYLATSLFIGWRRAKSAYLDALEEWEEWESSEESVD